MRRNGSIRLRWSLLLVLLFTGAISVGACSSEGGEQEGAASSSAPEGTPRSISPEALFTVGTVQGDSTEQLHNVVTPFPLDGGRLAVPQGSSNTILIFDEEGTLQRTLGGTGEGPGEFAALDGAWVVGDTIEAWDFKLKRITQFFPGDSVRVVPLEQVGGVQRAIPGRLGNSWAVMGVESAGFGTRDELVVHQFDLNGEHLGPLTGTKGMTRFRTSATAGPDPLSPRPLFAVSGGRLFVGETFTPRIQVFNADGDSVSTVKWTPLSTVSPEEAFQVIVDSAVARAESDQREDRRTELESFPVREQVSVFWDMKVDDHGYIWIQPYDPARHSLLFQGMRRAGPGGTWTVLSPDGEPQTTITVPDGVQPITIADDRVVGIRTNELGVEFVTVHALQRH